MKNFTATQVRSNSPNVVNESCELNLPTNHVRDPQVMSTEEWTDEKHSMYLKSMEASFVKQLYDSKQMLGWCFPKATFSHSTPTTSGQSKDLRGGCWKKMKNECHDLKGNPWIQQLRCSRNHGSVACAIVEESLTSRTTSRVSGLSQRKKIPSASTHLHLCHRDMFFSDIEVSDQNFVDEDVQCENKNVKRLKSLISDTSIRQC